MMRSPKVDKRDAAVILAQLQELRSAQDATRLGALGGDLDEALKQVFAAYSEILIDRLNRAPENHFRAFLNILGAAPEPPRAARAAISFFLAPGATGEVVVPARTQVAAQPQPGDPDPIVFETQQEFILTPARVDSLFVRNGSVDQYANLGKLLDLPGCDQLPAFHGNLNIPHVLYIGLQFPKVPVIDKLVIVVDAVADTKATSGAAPRQRPIAQVSWEIWDGKEVFPLTTVRDDTAGLTQGGQVEFEGFEPPPPAIVNGIPAQWIRCRLLSPLIEENPPQLGLLRSLSVKVRVRGTGLHPDAAAYQLAPLDLSTDFLPFGLRPRPGDLLYLASDEAFSQEDAQIAIDVELANAAAAERVDLAPGAPAARDVAVAPANPVGVVIRWESWDGTKWIPIDESTVVDETASFSRSGQIRFRLKEPVQRVAVAGQNKPWVRARIVSGDYGREATFEVDPSGAPRYTRATLAPPIIRTISLTYELDQIVPDRGFVVYNNFRFDRIWLGKEPVSVFRPPEDLDPALYLGFTVDAMPDSRFLSIYFGVHNAVVRQGAAVEGRAVLLWEYWNGSTWIPRTVEDETMNLRRSGITRVPIPPDAAICSEFDRSRHWLRIRRTPGFVDVEPRLRMVLLNTVMASQTLTVLDEVLGSSTGRPGQTFRTTRFPVLYGARVEVLQTDRSGHSEWVAWREVRTLLSSSPFDQDYVLDHLTGQITFGDNIFGAVPVAGKGNVRLRSYTTGGGRRGNLGPFTITELRKAIKYVDHVTNYDPSSGGADAQLPASLEETEPRHLRHRERAVTTEDYEDLARQASTGVARAYCVPLYDLSKDPAKEQRRPGVVSLIIVPESKEPAAPVSVEVLDQVRAYLDARRPPGAELILVGPDYLRVDVTAEVVVGSFEVGRRVEQNAVQGLREYLSTLTGRGGHGWPIGVAPTRSELLALLESQPDASYVRSVEVRTSPKSAELRGSFLVYPGSVAVTAVLEH